MLSHVMETYFSAPDEDNLSDAISEALMRSIIANLPVAIREPENYEARSNPDVGIHDGGDWHYQIRKTV